MDSFTANLAINCNLPAVILFAKAGDRLAYRAIVEAVIPATDGDLGTVVDTDVLSAARRLAARLDKAPATDQPLPV